MLLKIIEKGNLRMWKWETENDAKGVVVIAHNILEHTGRYDVKKKRNGYHVIMGDLPGQGQTLELIKVKLKILKNIMRIY